MRVSRGRDALILWPLAILVVAAFCALGMWQLDRMHEKQAMLDAVQQVLQQRLLQPLALAADPARTRDYDWAGGRGHFIDAPAVLLDNQQHDDRAGVRVYRLFQPEFQPELQAALQPASTPAAASAPLLVELGWLPLPGNRELPRVPTPPGELQLAGLLAPPPAHGIMAAVVAAQPDGQLLVTGLDAPGLARDLGQARLAPRVLKLDPANSLGYARDLDILPNTLPPERHLGYAVQWFALALAVLATALLLSFRKRKSSEPKP